MLWMKHCSQAAWHNKNNGFPSHFLISLMLEHNKLNFTYFLICFNSLHLIPFSPKRPDFRDEIYFQIGKMKHDREAKYQLLILIFKSNIKRSSLVSHLWCPNVHLEIEKVLQLFHFPLYNFLS
jgi:hypothetical protein